MEGNIAPEERITNLAAFLEAVAARQADRFEQAVKAAYAEGASREDLLAAVDTGRLLGQVPAPVRGQAYAAIHAWHWMVARRAANISRVAFAYA